MVKLINQFILIAINFLVCNILNHNNYETMVTVQVKSTFIFSSKPIKYKNWK